MISRTYVIEGLKSGECCKKVRKALNKLKGIRAIVDLKLGTSTVISTRYIVDEEIIAAVQNAGYSVKMV